MATPDQLARLKAVVPAAQASYRQWGVPASVTLAQWIFESSWGTSELATDCLNCFGVKCLGTTNPNLYMEFPTAEYVAGRRTMVKALFAKYPSLEASFAAHASLLANSARYRPAMAVQSKPEAFAVALQRCGYSTNPTYAHDLIEAMHAYNLEQYDKPDPSGMERA